ncbi:MAG: sugar phosphate isomerase/epimerase [Oscillospiraceae bacterium]|jgi:sugar phosphate isomerase/epimerase|nr:sugar phosphate isomerase/epimerase [Oscillospiraceae bacterium]
MKLAVSNIAWDAAHDNEMYSFIKSCGFTGLEIAPTRLFAQPYDSLAQAKAFAAELKAEYVLSIPSMQSIWFGRSENIFASKEERQALLEYTKKAILFAQVIDCWNLVFGCPKNRNLPEEADISPALEFFAQAGDFAQAHNTVFALEANPPIYNTNFINTTAQAFAICRELNNLGLRVNVDLGTIIYNNEDIDIVAENIDLVNHIHISEPYLEPIEKRALHKALLALNFDGFVSIEMKNTGSLEQIKAAVEYIAGESESV